MIFFYSKINGTTRTSTAARKIERKTLLPYEVKPKEEIQRNQRMPDKGVFAKFYAPL
jgi:hypothetical protein